jgi:hypothetical protein
MTAFVIILIIGIFIFALLQRDKAKGQKRRASSDSGYAHSSNYGDSHRDSHRDSHSDYSSDSDSGSSGGGDGGGGGGD